MQKNIIDKNGFVVTSVFVDANDNILFTNRRLEEDEQLVELNTDGNLVKPRWNGCMWIETATEEEKGSLFPVQEEIKVSNEERLQALEDALIALI